jgi:hypothetical protein
VQILEIFRKLLHIQFLFIQVETVGQVYMAVSGAPEYTPEHAENVADVALSLLRHVKQLKLPSGISIQIRIGECPRLPLHIGNYHHFTNPFLFATDKYLHVLFKSYEFSSDDNSVHKHSKKNTRSYLSGEHGSKEHECDFRFLCYSTECRVSLQM